MQENPMSPPPPQTPTESQVRMWQMWCHMSALAGIFLPFGNVLGPLIVWQVKKNEIPSIEAHGRAAMNFQLTILIAAVGCEAAAYTLSFFWSDLYWFYRRFPFGFRHMPVPVAVCLCRIVFAI